MAAISGKYSEVLLGSCNMLEFESWTLDYGSDPQPYNTRSGGGAEQSVAGVESGSGTITGFVDPNDLLYSQITTGSLVTVALYNEATSTTGWTGQIRIGKFSQSANRDGGPQPVSFAFTTNGLMTPPA